MLERQESTAGFLSKMKNHVSLYCLVLREKNRLADDNNYNNNIIDNDDNDDDDDDDDSIIIIIKIIYNDNNDRIERCN